MQDQFVNFIVLVDLDLIISLMSLTHGLKLESNPPVCSDFWFLSYKPTTKLHLLFITIKWKTT